MTTFRPAAGWGPEHKRAAICLTFDNLGEAAEIEVGLWGDKPVGQHFTAAFIPTLIRTLGRLRGTYFIEAINADIYPTGIRQWHAAGNEVGLHGWRHEFWAKIDHPTRCDVLKRSISAMRKIGVEPEGIRPPGGDVTDEVWEEFADAGLKYCSDASKDSIRVCGDVVSLPFDWPAVDAFFLEPIAAGRRESLGFRKDHYSAEEWGASLDALLARALEEGSQATIIFHSILLAADPAYLAVLDRLARRLEGDPHIWTPRMTDLASFVRDARGEVAGLAAGSRASNG